MSEIATVDGVKVSVTMAPGGYVDGVVVAPFGDRTEAVTVPLPGFALNPGNPGQWFDFRLLKRDRENDEVSE